MSTANQQVQDALRAIAPESPLHCARCGELLNRQTAVFLELNCETGLYGTIGTVPEAESQGCFEFGSACAKQVLKAGGQFKRIKGYKG